VERLLWRTATGTNKESKEGGSVKAAPLFFSQKRLLRPDKSGLAKTSELSLRALAYRGVAIPCPTARLLRRYAPRKDKRRGLL
jgi:hypothetical protein